MKIEDVTLDKTTCGNVEDISSNWIVIFFFEMFLFFNKLFFWYVAEIMHFDDETGCVTVGCCDAGVSISIEYFSS